MDIWSETESAAARTETINRLFGQKLAMARRLRKVSQSELGKRIKRSRVSVANLESGKHGVQLSQIFLLADALNANVSELLPDRQTIYEFEKSTDDAFVRFAKDRLNDMLRNSK